MKIDRELFRDIGHLRLATPGAATGLRQGERRSPYRGRGVEFADYRSYSPGDDLRLVDWNIYSRLETVLVRLFQEDRNLSLHVHVDASASMDFGVPRKSDHAGGLAACLALLGLLCRDTVSLGCSGERSPRAVVKGENTKMFGRMLEVLEAVEPAGRAAPWRQLRSQARHRPDRLFLISDMLYEDDAREKLLKTLAALSRAPVLLHVLSDAELAPNLDEPIEAVDAESGETLFVKTGLRAQRAYAKHLDEWLERLQRRCRSLGIHYVAAHTTVSIRDLLQSVLQRSRIVTTRSGGAP